MKPESPEAVNVPESGNLIPTIGKGQNHDEREEPTELPLPQEKDKKYWLRRLTSKVITQIVFQLNELDRKLTVFASNECPTGIDSMTATDSAENVKPYFKYLLWALKKKDIKNIALTGPYGSGKSSIIRTFQRRHPEFRYLNISLAKFDEEYKKNSNWRDEVEISILQQLFYHVRNRKIPDSRFKKIKKTTWWDKLLGTIFLVIFALSGYLLYNPGFLKSIPAVSFSENQTDYVLLGAFCAIIILSSILIYRLYRILLKLQIGRFSIDGTIELNKINETSIFNKHLDEIIYFFESTRYNIVIVEDIDRIDDPDIFVKFREINYLLNNSKQINRDIKFLYALRDDMFKDDERTKFFDFIIPVIPVANATNSVDKLLQKLADEDIDRIFLQHVSLYIDDMRTLINIVNEYILYKEMIGENLDTRKLLAMVIYKNLNPGEFEKLHEHGKGEITQLFSNKGEFVKSALKKLDEQITSITNEIDRLEKLVPKNLEQLRTLYLYKTLEKLPDNHIPNTSNFSKFNTDGNIEQIKASKIVKSKVPAYNSFRQVDVKVDWPKIEKEINSDFSYDDLVQKAGDDINISSLKDELQQLRDKRDQLFKLSLKELIEQNLGFEFPEGYKTKQLLTYLILNGYIDESYPNYISYFYEGKLTLKDREFTLSILNNNPLQKNAEVNNSAVVYENLYLNNYSNPAILNVTFFKWLIADENKHKDELGKIESILLENNHIAIEFIEAVIKEVDAIGYLMKGILPKWPGFWNFLVETQKFDDEKLSVYFILLLRHLPVEAILSFDGKIGLGKYIASSRALYRQDELKHLQNKFLELADPLDFKIPVFNHDKELAQLYKGIYEQRKYKMNPRNIKEVLSVFGGEIEELDLDFPLANYTVIRKSKAEHLKRYVAANIREYVEEIVIGVESNIEESKEAFAELLSYPPDQLPLVVKQGIIDQQTNKITNILDVTDDTWATLFEKNKIISSWDNILKFMEQGGSIPNELVTFLNILNNVEKLETLETEPTFPFENQTILSSHLIFAENGFTEQSYSVLLGKIRFKLDGIELHSLPYGKLATLVRKNKLLLNQLNVESLQTLSSDLLGSFVSENYKDFVANEGIKWLNVSGLSALVKTGNISPARKINIIVKIDPLMLHGSNELADSLQTFFNENPRFIATERTEFLRKVFDSSSHAPEKIKLFANLLPVLAQEDIQTMLPQLGEDYGAIITGERQMVKFPDNEENTYLFGKLESYGLFSSCSEGDNEIRVNLFRKKKEEG